MDTMGAGVAFKLSGMGQQGGLFFFTFSTLKTVDDHCGYKLPWDPLQWAFWNNAEYHDIHHQSWGIKVGNHKASFFCLDVEYSNISVTLDQLFPAVLYLLGPLAQHPMDRQS